MWMIGIGLGAAALLAGRLTKKRRLRRPLRLLGAALLAGIGAGVYAGKEEAAAMVQPDLTFHPRMADRDRDLALYGWHRAVERSRGWVEPDK